MTADDTGLTSRVRLMVWREGVGEERPGGLQELRSLRAETGAVVWVDEVAPDPADIALLATALGLPAATVEGLRTAYERPRFVRASDHVSFVVYAVDRTDDVPGHRLRQTRVSGLVHGNTVVTIRSDDGFDIDEVVRRWHENPDLIAGAGTGALLYGLLDTAVDGHFTTVQRLDDAIEDLEDSLFDDMQGDRAFVRKVYDLRKDLVHLRRIILPMREVVNGMLRHGEADPVLTRWSEDLYDHVLRVAEWTESLRDLVTSLFETNLSLQDIRLNQVMRRLAAWAAIIAVPTAVTGWFGQNLPYPGYLKPFGLWLSIALIVLVGGGLVIFFRRRGWL